jgi:ParB family chromosome partitioning protein
MSDAAKRVVGPRFTRAQPSPPPALGHAGTERALASAHEVDVDQLHPDTGQPRRQMDRERLAELAASIVAHGVLQPLLVRSGGFDARGDMCYTIIAGGRRYAAIQLALSMDLDPDRRARLRRVPVVVSASEEAATRILQLIENLQREDLPPIEEAQALREVMALEGLSLRGLAARVNRSLGYVEERLRLLRHAEVSDAVAQGILTKSAGAAVASLPEAAQRQRWLERARAGEVVQPADIYASKGPRRAGRSESVPPSVPPRGVHHVDAPVPAADPLVSVQNLDTPVGAAESAAPQQPGDATRDALLRTAIEALLARPDPTEQALVRAVVREVLQLGAAHRCTCAALLPFVQGPSEH